MEKAVVEFVFVGDTVQVPLTVTMFPILDHLQGPTELTDPILITLETVGVYVPLVAAPDVLTLPSAIRNWLDVPPDFTKLLAVTLDDAVMAP